MGQASSSKYNNRRTSGAPTPQYDLISLEENMRATQLSNQALMKMIPEQNFRHANDMEELRSTVEMIPRNIPEISRHMILANNDGDSDADDYE